MFAFASHAFAGNAHLPKTSLCALTRQREALSVRARGARLRLWTQPGCSLIMGVFLNTPTLEQAKADLIERVKDLDMGRIGYSDAFAKELDEKYIKPLEAMNPTRTPVESPLLDGRWRLIYTNSKNVLGLDRPNIARPLRNSIYQTIYVERGQVVNEERVLFGLLTNRVQAVFTPEPPRRVRVQFKQFQFGLLRVPAPARARGWLDITYLDEDMRISRGNLANVFVLLRD
ncbi:similar to fibrillin [Cyanidioschyzon merolae strain 10D]|uniref:Similar to fibrillin n=1 Tax=Cyanidioschyzon merolae (strain NIES-3377 / 10D) TaxID=280699 RepID=M1VA44_CYAM1|nr:similar to fibrillin [Cyanidioschyzon merolae strain 10D]BAM81919.1 similar to fibrillin [Cyanidioschyzon merolae strain 10D]|eukprot:XP_005537955.1 similar to fibrillin [Cyanidioschyzon merolae strain 10D]